MSNTYFKKIEIESGSTYALFVSELKYISIIDIPYTSFEHLQMIKYLDIIVDDVMVYGVDFKVEFSIYIDHQTMNFECNYLYPFINGLVIFIIDLSRDVSVQRVAKTLDHMIDINIMHDQQINYTDLSQHTMFGNIDIVDQALFYEGKLKEVFSKRSLFEESIKFSFFDLNFLNNGATEIQLLSLSAGVSIWIDINKVSFRFDGKDSSSWYFTDEASFDMLSIRQLFVLYLGKKLNKPIIDVRREIQLIEMQTI
jgi:hypothetical protein